MNEGLQCSVLDDPSKWVLPAALIEHAERRPDAPWFESTTGERLSFAEAASDAQRMAGFFAELGAKSGERIAVMMPNGIDFVRVWLGLGALGAVAVLLNTDLSGVFLEHQLRNCGAEVVVCDTASLNSLATAAGAGTRVRLVVVAGEVASPPVSLELLPLRVWRGAVHYPGPLPRARDIACIMYTSGTTGPAKGVLMPHAHCTLFGIGAMRSANLGPEDRHYIVLPLFHANGLLMQLGATLLAGIPAYVRPRFSAASWLSDIRRYQATVTNALGVMAAFILAEPPGRFDRDHSLRVFNVAPNLPEHELAIRERFGVPEVISGFGMTEVNIPVWGRAGQPCPGAAGWVHENHFEVIIANPETDCELPRGEVGELLVRPKVPFGFMAGYHEMPEKTVEAWRNLWFHTGDAGTMREDGLVTFVDRIKDCIRRRGENISATEIETAVATMPGVAEIAACAVPSEIPGGEDEVLLTIVPRLDVALEPTDVATYADSVLPRFAHPRFIAFVQELPKTSTGKIQRSLLRKNGTAGAWDRGMEIRPVRKVDK